MLKNGMTEGEFWMFLEENLRRGRMDMMCGSIDSDDPVIQKTGQYIGGHSVLFKDHDKIAISKVFEMGALLADRSVSIEAKEAILMLLAHHPTTQALDALKRYSENPDKGLEIFASLALDECEMWNE